MGAAESFVVGDTIKFQNDIYVDDALTDPTTKTWVIELPDGTDVSLTEASGATGIWTATYLTTQAGWHVVQFKGAGNSADYVRERDFYVGTSAIF